MAMASRLRALDLLAVLGGIATVVAVSLIVYAGPSGPPEVRVSGRGGEWIYPLDRAAEIEIPGPLGSTWVHIEDGRVRIERSPCPNQTCVAAGSISGVNQWVACLPNEVFVRIAGSAGGGTGDDQVDAVVN